MPYGNRVANQIGSYAEGDKMFETSVFNGTSGTLTVGMPVYKQLTDAAEFNAKFSATALSPTTAQTGGTVVLSTDATTNVFAFVGIYQPSNPGDLPNKGDVIRILTYGEGQVLAISETANTNPLKVGDVLVAKAVSTAASTAGATPSARISIAVVLATKTFITVGAQITAAAANVATLVNAFVAQT